MLLEFLRKPAFSEMIGNHVRHPIFLEGKIHYSQMDVKAKEIDEHWMAAAMAEAGSAQEAGEVPVGAVVVRHGKVIGRGQNRNLRDHDPSAHAEIVAMREAGRFLRNHRLEGCELFVIIEPCAMCAGAMVHARLKRLVYGAKDPKAGAVESVIPVVNHPKLNHQMEITGGVLEEECSQMLRNFFRAKRVMP